MGQPNRGGIGGTGAAAVACLLGAVLHAGPGQGKTVVVDGKDSAAIEAAITRSGPGDTVSLPAGSYAIRQAIRPNSNTRLTGGEQDKTVLRFAGGVPAVMIDLAGRQDVEVCRLTLDGAGNPNATQGISAGNARRLDLHHLTIRHLVKGKGFGPHGILFAGQNPTRERGVTDSRITDCRIENIGVGAKFGGGIRLAWGSSRNQVLRCAIKDTGRGGIFADNGSTDAVIRSNTVTGSGGEGLGIEVWGGSDRAVIEDNRIDHWLSIGGCDYAAARRNVISDTSGTYKFCGIEAIGSCLVITGNAVDGGQKIGLSVSSKLVKNYVFWGRNTVRACNQWGTQFQGEAGGIAYHYLYRCKFVSMPMGRGPVWYPGDEGHGFRTNGNVRHITMEACEFSKNHRFGLQLGGANVDGLSFVRCTIKDNKGAAVSGPGSYSALEWVDCTVEGNGSNELPPGRPFGHPPPVASFRAPDEVRVGRPAKFVSTSRTDHGKIAAVLWDFDDGVPSTDAQPTHVYHKPGQYRVTLIVWDSHGRAARAERELTVKPDGTRPDPHERHPSTSARVPRKENAPIVKIKKETYKRHPRPRAAAMVSVRYVGPKLERMEIHALEIRDDVPSEPKCRLSTDNGRTWSPFVPLPPTLSYPKGVEVWEGSGAKFYDPVSGVLVDTWLRQIALKGHYNNFTYYRLSRDYGRTWTTPKQLRYEQGESFDPDDPLKPGFLKHNQAYFGSNILRHSNGTLIHAVAHANAPDDAGNDSRPWRMGSLCFIGRWDAEAKDYRWTAGKRVSISPDISSRGLMEPEVAELTDGRVLVVWRGSNTAKTPGRKWYSVSTDGGAILSTVKEWSYDDGSRFYSPSSYHRMIRHSVTGRLYWIGNICAAPPSGNSPRYPLVIAEVDEAIPALKRRTVTVIDDRRPDQPAAIQFSNFSLLEDRQTHDLELYLTAYGEDPASVYTADSYKYTLTFRKPT